MGYRLGVGYRVGGDNLLKGFKMQSGWWSSEWVVMYRVGGEDLLKGLKMQSDW